MGRLQYTFMKDVFVIVGHVCPFYFFVDILLRSSIKNTRDPYIDKTGNSTNLYKGRFRWEILMGAVGGYRLKLVLRLRMPAPGLAGCPDHPISEKFVRPSKYMTRCF